MPVPPTATPLRVALGLALILAAGVLLVAAARTAAGRRPFRDRLAEDLALAWAVGPAAAVPAIALAAAAGLPLRGRPLSLALVAIVVAAAGLAGLGWRGGARRRAAAGADGSVVAAAGAAVPRRLRLAGGAVVAAALALALVKVARVPLWSWDHFAIWGLKARLFAAAGNLDVALVDRFERVPTHTDYPLGVPLGWLAATLGAMPADGVVRLLHAGGLVALVALVHAAAGRLSAHPLAALAAAGFVAVSPLAWDSVHLGLAELPLALVAVAAVTAALAALGPPPRSAPAAPAAASRAGWALAGLLVGFLPWVKVEGAPLAALLGGMLALWRWRAGRPGRAGDLGAFAGLAALVGGAAIGFGLLLPRGVSFFDGPWAERLAHRLAHPGEVLGPLANELSGPAWLGVWWILPLILAVAVRGRDHRAWTLAAVATAQLALYTAVFFTTYLAPADHVATALPRIAAALVPLVALAAAALASPSPPGAAFARRTVP